MSWSYAKKYCEEVKKMHLAEILDLDILDSTVKPLVPAGTGTWIGLARPSSWYWSETNEAAKWTNWWTGTGQPNNNGDESCAVILVGLGRWSDENCRDQHPFFCYGRKNKPQISTVIKS